VSENVGQASSLQGCIKPLNLIRQGAVAIGFSGHLLFNDLLSVDAETATTTEY
jgi:hypothetical protein